jgi:putative spermidine/putrescine transport system permease protein
MKPARHAVTAALLLPGAAVLGLFALAVGGLVQTALVGPDGVSLRYLRQIVERPDYLVVMQRTVLMSLAVAVSASLLAYPIAFLLWRAPRWRNRLLVLVLLPWLVSIVVRTYGWMVILGPRGTLNEALAWLGLIDAPVRLMFNDLGILIGLTHVLMPFAVIAILSAMLQIDPRLEEASESLGARPGRTLWRVLLPLSAPGIFVGINITFLTSMGAVVTPILLGGIREKMAGTQIYQDIVYAFNLPKASSWALMLLATAFLVLVLLRMIEAQFMRRFRH